jgi:ribosomal-protein-alanine N-acetyltransferase
MDTTFFLTTARLLIQPITIHDDNFIFELLNTEGWIKFIGNRNIASRVEAGAYIQKILENENISYWVVRIKDSQKAIGVLTFIKRDYLEHHDIGFAFLSAFCKNGYAYEATNAVLKKLIQRNNLLHILAITIPENTNSIKLLNKLGLVFDKEIEIEKEKVHVYGASKEKLQA